jgi:hypothetical protein
MVRSRYSGALMALVIVGSVAIAGRPSQIVTAQSQSSGQMLTQTTASYQVALAIEPATVMLSPDQTQGATMGEMMAMPDQSMMPPSSSTSSMPDQNMASSTMNSMNGQGSMMGGSSTNSMNGQPSMMGGSSTNSMNGQPSMMGGSSTNSMNGQPSMMGGSSTNSMNGQPSMMGGSSMMMMTTDNGQPVNHHLEVQINSISTGSPQSGLSPQISIANDSTGQARSLEDVVAMYDVQMGPSDLHYGNNLYLQDGATYTITVTIGNETALFSHVPVSGGMGLSSDAMSPMSNSMPSQPMAGH